MIRHQEGNLIGDGMTMGGLMVVSKNEVHYAYSEKVFGDRAPMEDVISAAKAAVASSSN